MLYDAINHELAYSSKINTTITSTNIATFLCPSEPNQQPKQSFFGLSGVPSYGWNIGDWYVFQGFNGPVGRNVFYPNTARKLSDLPDRTSKTFPAAGGKTNFPMRPCPQFGNTTTP